MKRNLAATALVLLFIAAFAFSQSAGASLSGTITDSTGGILPGVTLVAANTQTGVTYQKFSNDVGVYNFPSLPVGTYTVTADLSGFQKKTFTDVLLRSSAQVRLNITLQVQGLNEEVEVSVAGSAQTLEAGSSVGLVLPEEKVTQLPEVNNDVLNLVKVMGGTVLTDQNPIFAANDTTLAGVSAGDVNLERDGVTVNEVRYESGLNTALRMNNDMVSEFKVLLAPVDAEVGRGNGQIQLITKSGTNEFHGSAVWSLQNTALDSNQYYFNRTNTQPDWRNVNEYSLGLGGPIIKDKTFFYVFWDQQLAAQRHTANTPVLTPCARKGIFRYYDNWVSGNINTATVATGFTPTIASVDSSGHPVAPPGIPDGVGGIIPQTMPLRYAYVFGALRPDYTDDDLCSHFNPATDVVGGPWDPNRTQLDPSGYIAKFTAMMPSANNYEIGDGLNTAGSKWDLRYSGGDNIFGVGEDNLRKQINVKIDHTFSDRHWLTGSYSFEDDNAADSFKTWPSGYGGAIQRKPQLATISLISTLKPTLLNEFRFGLSRTANVTYDPIENPDTGSQMKDLLQTLYPTTGPEFANYSGLPLIISPGSGNAGFQVDVFSTGAFFSGMGASNPLGSRGNLPVTFGGHDQRWTFADSISWTKSNHSFKGGVELRLAKSYQERNGTGAFINDADVFVEAVGGASQYAPVQGINGFDIPGLAGFPGVGSVGTMEGLLNYMSGSLANVRQYLFINSPDQTDWLNYSQGYNSQIFDIRTKELSLFFKDDWKLTHDLTLNLGLRYDYYGVPYVQSGMTVGLDGGPLAIFGVSGRSFDQWMSSSPEVNLDLLTKQIFVGPNSPNGNDQVYSDDYNNFGPAVGFAWQLPWFGKGKTTLRGGYQLTYLPMGRADDFAGVIANTIGTRFVNSYSGSQEAGSTYLDIAHLSQYTPPPVPSTVVPLAPVDITDRTQPYTVYDQNLRNPYVQNLTLALVRNFGSNVSLDLRYVGTLTRKSIDTLNLNSPNFLNNGLIQAFNDARNGNESPLLDRMFNGVNIEGYGGCGPVGSTCNGVLQTGAAQLRTSGMFSGFTTYASLLANGDYSALASGLAIANYNTTYPGNYGLPAVPVGVNGALLRYANSQPGQEGEFPENFIYTNPQFSSASLIGNYDHSNYHSMQAQITVRPTHGLSLVGTYTWSRNLGLTGPYSNVLDRNADYTLLSSHRSHQLVLYGNYSLPFGMNGMLFKNASKALDRAIGGWQMSWIFNLASGSPNSITAATMLYANGVPDFVGPPGSFDTKMGHVTWTPGAISGNYFDNKYVNVPDPQCSAIAAELQPYCTLQAIALASDPSVIVFQNPQPGTQGNFGRNNLTNPGRWDMDAALTKSFRIAEGKSISIRIDATNVFNHPTPSYGISTVSTKSYIANPPYLTMNPDAFGVNHPFGYVDNKVGNRSFQGKVRFDF